MIFFIDKWFFFRIFIHFSFLNEIKYELKFFKKQKGFLRKKIVFLKKKI